MSHLFNHNGAENTGYSQPTPLSCDTEPTVPKGLVRSDAARWPLASWLYQDLLRPRACL